jgi:hypothetical protein
MRQKEDELGQAGFLSLSLLIALVKGYAGYSTFSIQYSLPDTFYSRFRQGMRTDKLLAEFVSKSGRRDRPGAPTKVSGREIQYPVSSLPVSRRIPYPQHPVSSTRQPATRIQKYPSSRFPNTFVFTPLISISGIKK